MGTELVDGYCVVVGIGGSQQDPGPVCGEGTGIADYFCRIVSMITDVWNTVTSEL